MPDSHKNFSYSTVATAPSPATSGTSLVVAAADGTKFPTVPFNATVWPAATQPTAANAEIVRVTTISTDTFTITRAQESSSARTVVVGDQIAATVTAKTLTDVEGDVALKAPLASPTFTGTVTIPGGASISGFAPLASPTFTGTATAAALTATGATTLGSTGQTIIDASGNISAAAGLDLQTTALGTKTSSYNIVDIAPATTITLNAASLNYKAARISPVVTLTTAPGISGTVMGLAVNQTIGGGTGATDMFALGIFTGVSVADVIATSDTNSRTLLAYTAIGASPTMSNFSGGTLVISTLNQFATGQVPVQSGVTVSALNGLSIGAAQANSGGTLTAYAGVNIVNPPASGGSFGTMVGIDIAQLTRATTNIGLRNAGATVLTAATVSVTSNAGTVPVTVSNAKFTNSSASAMTVTMAVTGATDGQVTEVRIFDASGVTKAITWVNTENGYNGAANITAPANSLGSTTIPTYARFMYNSATTKWTCVEA